MRFYFTFGMQYATEAHSSFVSGRVPVMRDAHPDNWVEVEAPDFDAARRIVLDHLGTAWCWQYDEQEWASRNPAHFPGRCIATFTEDGEAA